MLTKKDVKKEGWKQVRKGNNVIYFRKDDFNLMLFPDYRKGYNVIIDRGEPPIMIFTKFEGICKNRKDLRKIMKMIGL